MWNLFYIPLHDFECFECLNWFIMLHRTILWCFLSLLMVTLMDCYIFLNFKYEHHWWTNGFVRFLVEIMKLMLELMNKLVVELLYAINLTFHMLHCPNWIFNFKTLIFKFGEEDEVDFLKFLTFVVDFLFDYQIDIS